MSYNKVAVWVCAAVVLPSGVLLTSCVSGPDYRRPELASPAGFKSAEAQESAQPDLGRDWWILFKDPDLDALEKQAIEANLNLQAAMARVAEARAASAAVKSAFFPVITANPSSNRSRTPGGGFAGPSTNSNTQLPFDLSYEIDIWGRVHRQYEAAKAQMQASMYDVEVVRQTLLADVAQNYFSLRSFECQDQIIARNVALYREQLELTELQFKSGLASETNVLQAKTLLDSTLAQQTDVNRQRTDLEHAIAILLGKAPADFSLGARPYDMKPPVIPAGLPADLLRRRPDVAEAEQSLVAANAQIGVATANQYPTLKLTGVGGFESIDIEHTLDWQSRIWSIGANMLAPIFEGGQLKANVRQAKAKYEELQATYRNAVLGAYRDVEDALTNLHMRADQSESQARAVASARGYLELTQLQYRTGLVSYLQVIDADRTLLTNELSLEQIQNQRMVSTVLLIKALGGGWDAQGAT